VEIVRSYLSHVLIRTDQDFGMGLMTLLSDFGLRDSYVGVMKGVIYGIYPGATIVDLSHEVLPQDVMGGRFQLLMAEPYFPEGTVHVAVVDPGVGTPRRGVAFTTGRSMFVGPDNGLLVLDRQSIVSAVELDRPEFWRLSSRDSTSSATFQGRDIFAVVGAHLAQGVPLEAVGRVIDPASLVELELPENGIQAIDRFGNCITTVVNLGLGLGWQVRVRGQMLRSVRTYGDAELGEAIALVGSHGFVEIAVNGGTAQGELGVQVGDPIEMIPPLF
jgi:S-adenosyl-L-methionine hydrolase (adenosine-forming)